MKKILMGVLAALMMVGCGSNAKTYVIEGNIAGLEGNVAILTMSGEEVLAEQEVSDGTFTMNIESEAPLFAVLAIEGEPMLPVFIDGSPISIQGDMQQPQYLAALGTPSNAGYAEFNETQNAILMPAMAEGASEEDMAKAFVRMQEYMDGSYEQNKDNLWGAYLLISSRVQMMGAEEILETLAAYPAEYAKVEEIAAVKKMAEGMLKTEIGGKYINIKLPNVDGKEVSLQSVVKVNKFVLLDFWASWCRPCMGEMPYLKAAYAEYHDKGFEIYGVSLDEDEAAWKGTIESVGMEWVNVSSLEGFKDAAAADYTVNSIPSNFLIDADGKIVAKNLRGEALAEKLAELLQ